MSLTIDEMSTGKVEKWRLFIGMFPAPPVAEALATKVELWKKETGEAHIKWVPAHKLHLTLAFLGSVPIEKVKHLKAQLEQISAEPLHLELAGLGCFPNVRRPRVLWAGIKGDIQSLLKLQQRIDKACGPFIEKPEDKAFSPHLTLARIKHEARQAPLKELLEEQSDHSFGSWTALDFRLVRSRLGGKNPGYAVLQSFLLGAGK